MAARTELGRLEDRKKEVISKLKELLKSELHETGFYSGFTGGRIRAYAFAKPKKMHLHCLSSGEFEGFFDDGIIEEAHIGLVTIDYASMPLEDVLSLYRWVIDKGLPARR